MALSQADVDAFLGADKQIAASVHVRWTHRNRSTVFSRVGAEVSALTVGELVMVVRLNVARNWTFSLVRRRIEVLRWDLTSPPMRHRNPPACPSDFPRTVRTLEHEHCWVFGLGTTCALPLGHLGEAAQDHRRALDAFCDRANIVFNGRYEPPPPASEQLTLI